MVGAGGYNPISDPEDKGDNNPNGGGTGWGSGEDDEGIDLKGMLYTNSQKALNDYNRKASRKEDRRLAKQAEHEAKVLAHQADKKAAKEVAKLQKQQGKADARAARIAAKHSDRVSEDHKPKGGNKGKDGKGAPVNQESVDQTVNQKLQNDVDNKDQQRQTEDKIDLAVLGVAACAVLLFVYFASRS
jgi:hypothetical protein